ncbi:MAG: hypothetical protein Q7S64_02090 [bacterium]|nr:hypothetical protein [bacterium]
MIGYLTLCVVLIVIQLSFANLLTWGFSSLFPFLIYLVLLLYLDLNRPLWWSVVLSGFLLDVFSSHRFGNFLFILLAVFLAATPLFSTSDKLIRLVRSLLLVFLASVFLQYVILQSYATSLAIISWPLLLTGLVNTLCFYLVLVIVRRLVTNE